ncbi:uncharacterized protein [Hyperolius riggenbachi]|uniref:uncharacterized protein n=1 Tax=Hyperolius riggenbachi TaxID=752182 RepID=UPI0035A27CF9
MDKDGDRVAKKILKLTLKIIYLLTGEDYGPIKKQCVCNAACNRGQDNTVEPLPHSLSPDRYNNKEILDVINNITELLTREVPIRCQDITVYFSMEEWHYLEGHKDLYENIVMEDLQPLSPLDGASYRNTLERCPSPAYAQDGLDEVTKVSQQIEEDRGIQDPKQKADHIIKDPEEKDDHIIQDPKEKDDHIIQDSKEKADQIIQDPKEKADNILKGFMNKDFRFPRDSRQEVNNLPKGLKQDVNRAPKDSKQEVNLIPKDRKQDADHHPKDSKQDAGQVLQDETQEVDQIQNDCRQEIELIRKICRQEVETILKDCKREIERIQMDCRPEVNCTNRDCKQEAGHISKDSTVERASGDCKQEVGRSSKDCRQEAEHIPGHCKLEADTKLKDCKKEVDRIQKDCRRSVDNVPKDCKRKSEQIQKDCRWDAGSSVKDCEQEDNEVQPYYEEEHLKDVKIEILSDDEWNDEEWDDQYKDGDSPIYINTDGSSGGSTPEQGSQNAYLDSRDEDYESPQDYPRLVRAEDKASSLLSKSNSQMLPKNYPDNGTTSTTTLNTNTVKRGPMSQSTFSSGQMELMTQFRIPPAQEASQAVQHHHHLHLHQQQHKNINTARKTTSDIQTLQNFLSEMNENRKVEEIPHTELDTLLSKFLLVVKRKDGNEYEPHTLRCMVGSIDRYLKEHRYMHTIVYGNGKDFPLTKQSLNAKIKFLKKIAESNPPIRQEALTDDDIEKLYKTGTLSMDNPTSLLNLVFFNNGIHFALRTKEQYNLQWGDIKLKIDPRGNQYIEYTDRQTEMEENRKSGRQIKPRMYATPHTPDRDPVTAYLKYRSFRPAAMMTPDAPFYLAPNINYNPAFSEWYRSTKIGIQKIRAMMTTMKIRASLPESKKKVGYITKKRLVERLPQHLLTSPSVSQTMSNNIHSSINYRMANEVMQHKTPTIASNVPTSVASQVQDKMMTSNSYHPRPSTSRYGEPPVNKRSFVDADFVQHHNVALQRNSAMYLNNYPQLIPDEPAKKRKSVTYDYTLD